MCKIIYYVSKTYIYILKNWKILYLFIIDTCFLRFDFRNV